ncbi:hypothetical protein LUX33_02745 [Actinomadura madurae]|nr:hypothetical protein [Actinomadura madurae]MCP9947482.1 hypothetical protein [Actinomadura madurae]
MPVVGENAAASSPSALIMGESRRASAAGIIRLGTPSAFCRATLRSNDATSSGRDSRKR